MRASVKKETDAFLTHQSVDNMANVFMQVRSIIDQDLQPDEVPACPRLHDSKVQEHGLIQPAAEGPETHVCLPASRHRSLVEKP
jgi:hypothetical protein